MALMGGVQRPTSGNSEANERLTPPTTSWGYFAAGSEGEKSVLQFDLNGRTVLPHKRQQWTDPQPPHLPLGQDPLINWHQCKLSTGSSRLREFSVQVLLHMSLLISHLLSIT